MDLFYRLLFPALWFVWIFYWTLSARNTKRTARRESTASRLSHGIPLWIAVLLFSWPDGRGHGVLFSTIWPRSMPAYCIGVVIVLIGFAVTIWARVTLGRNWSGSVTIKEHHELIQCGPYQWVRHPIYTGLVLAFWGSAVGLDEWRGVLAAVLVLVAFRIKLGIEEDWMTQQFGPNYEAYRKRTKMLVPFLW